MAEVLGSLIMLGFGIAGFLLSLHLLSVALEITAWVAKGLARVVTDANARHRRNAAIRMENQRAAALRIKGWFR